VHYAVAGEARLAVGHLLQPRIEAEIQLHFARTPPVTRDEQAILESILNPIFRPTGLSPRRTRRL
jgi:hypothetical protein